MKRWILLIVMALLAAIPVVFWAQALAWGMPLGYYLYAVGRVLALVGFVMILFQFVLSSKVKWIERGIGLDKLYRIHKISGLTGLVLILIHPAFLFWSDLAQGYIPSFTPLKAVGLVSQLVLLVAAGSALLSIRLRLKYETWKAIHWTTYAGLPLGFAHSILSGSDLTAQPLRAFWIALAGVYVAVVVYRLWHRAQVRRHPFRVVGVVQETHDTWSLTFDGPKVDYMPGQFLILQLVQGGRASEPHPFTLSSSPTSDKLSVSVKSVGDFTSTVGETQVNDRAYIDAPYGTFSFLAHDSPSLVFIAGGIGITPFMSMLRYMRDQKMERNVVLVWGNKTQYDIAFKDELDEMGAQMPSLEVTHVMSAQEDWRGEKGYLDAGELRRLMSSVEDPEVFVCGPPVMMTKVIRALRDLGVPRRRIHYERFALR